MGCGRTYPCVVFEIMIVGMGPVVGLPKATYNMAGSHVSISLYCGEYLQSTTFVVVMEMNGCICRSQRKPSAC